jgi:hypothetical protein
MPLKTLSFRHVPGLQISEGRAVGFLEGHRELNAAESFDDLSVQEQRHIRVHMEEWVAGNNGPKSHFHCFDPPYRECIVFKYQEHRLYDFLCHPKPITDRRFELCVLNIYATKFRWDTDNSELRRVEGWRLSLGTQDAIAYEYQEYRRGTTWTN